MSRILCQLEKKEKNLLTSPQAACENLQFKEEKFITKYPFARIHG